MKKLILYLLVALAVPSFAQDLKYTKKTLKILTSKKYWGRGYIKNGMTNAAQFIENEFKNLGLAPIEDKDYLQYFELPVNTFPKEMEVKLNGKKLQPGKEFIVHPTSKAIKQKTTLSAIDSLNYISVDQPIKVTIQDKLTWSVARQVKENTQILVKKTAIREIPKDIEVNIAQEFIANFKAANVAALIKGTSQPDSIIVITAHYDHLGGMGAKTYFPGANDNASGVSFLLSLAKYYAKNPQPYSIAFICFAAEEAGILGSKHFTENPLFPLQNIKFLFNVDMVGSGELGATVVNATAYPKAFKALLSINEKHNYLTNINARGKAANSDHYYFTEKGVPAFFLYTHGGTNAYHDVFDQSKTLAFPVYQNLFRLFVDFNTVIMTENLN